MKQVLNWCTITDLAALQEPYQWPHTVPITQIGSRVLVTFNRFGWGTVTGYFLAEPKIPGPRVLGLVLEPEHPPIDWAEKYHNSAHVFAPEVELSA